MKVDDTLSGLAAVLFGVFLIYWSRGFRAIAHIPYGPGFFPALIGGVLIGAGLFLIGQRLVIQRRNRQALALLQFGPWVRSVDRVGALVLFLGAILFYILVVERLGFLLTMPIILATLIWWLDRRPLLAVAVAIVATVLLQAFFQQFMIVPLPWGLLKPWAGTLTWM